MVVLVIFPRGLFTISIVQVADAFYLFFLVRPNQKKKQVIQVYPSTKALNLGPLTGWVGVAQGDGASSCEVLFKTTAPS